MKLKLAQTFLILFLASCSTAPLSQTLSPSPKTHRIDISKFRFQPYSLVVRPGDRVQWVNRDIVPHRIAHVSRKTWESQDIRPGNTFSRVFSKSTSYICPLHPGMQGEITVSSDL